MTVSGENEQKSPYAFKSGPYSSHTLLLSSFPARGEGRRVLDVGGGEGYLTRPLAARGYQVVCLAAPRTVAGPLPVGVTVCIADLNRQKPAVGTGFDFVLCGDVIEHILDPLDFLIWLRELLKPGGRLIASLPNSGHLHFRLNVLCGRFPAHERGLFDRTHLHFFTWGGWKQLFTQARLKIDSVRPTSVPIGLALGVRQDHIGIQILENVCYRLAVVWKSLFAYQFVVVTCPEEMNGSGQ